MIHNILNNWNLFRFLRLGVGIAVIVEGIQAGTWLMVGLGALFTLMPLMNIGCCASGNCAVPTKSVKPNVSEEVTFEEVKKTSGMS